MRWANSYTSAVAWPNSLIYSNLNGSSFLKNITFVPSGWEEKIATVEWKHGSSNPNATASTLFAEEDNWASKTSAKVGLMYLHDYYYGMVGGNNCSPSGGVFNTCKTSWIFISLNDNSYLSVGEWTMSLRSGTSSNEYRVNYIYEYGPSDTDYLTGSITGPYTVRPVFFLDSKVEYIDGNGTLEQPFIID